MATTRPAPSQPKASVITLLTDSLSPRTSITPLAPRPLVPPKKGALRPVIPGSEFTSMALSQWTKCFKFLESVDLVKNVPPFILSLSPTLTGKAKCTDAAPLLSGTCWSSRQGGQRRVVRLSTGVLQPYPPPSVLTFALSSLKFSLTI